MLDYRYVYVFKVRGKQLYKIGISKDWRIRRYQVEDTRSMRMRLRLLIAVPLFFASKVEKKLHRKFKSQRKKLKGVSGGTEFFELNGYDGRIGLRGELLKYFALQLIFLILLFMTIGLSILDLDWEEYIKAMLN
ncbi:MAG: GIY-YIG nuclease family protein [Bacteroidota bacterium]